MELVNKLVSYMKQLWGILCLYFILCPAIALPKKTSNKEYSPEDLGILFKKAYGENATQMYLGRDTFGRDHIAVHDHEYGEVYHYAVYRDPDTGMLWQILVDEEQGKEVPFINIKKHDGAIKSYHPEKVEQLDLKAVVSSDSLMHPPDYIPYYPEVMVKSNSALKEGDRCSTLSQNPEGCDGDDSSCYASEIPPVVTEQNDNWWPYALIGGGSVIALGAYGIYYLFTNTATGSRYLRRNDLWSMWRPDEPYEVLLLLEPQDMAQDLMHDITIRYSDATNLMQCFLEDLQEEYDTLLQWLQFRKQLAPWCISLGGAFDMIEHRLMLLDRMRDAVYYWRAQQLRNSQS